MLDLDPTGQAPLPNLVKGRVVNGCERFPSKGSISRSDGVDIPTGKALNQTCVYFGLVDPELQVLFFLEVFDSSTPMRSDPPNSEG